MSIEPVIYRNESDDVFIIDVPTSIAVAQGFGRCLEANGYCLTSCPPVAEPFASTEPKSKTSTTRVTNHQEDASVHDLYASLILDAIADIKRKHRDGSFCHERLPSRLSASNRKRGAEEAFDSTTFNICNSATVNLETDIRKILHGLATRQSSFVLQPYLPHALTAVDVSDNCDPMQEQQIDASDKDAFFRNLSEQSTTLHAVRKDGQQNFSFRIPPRSSFLLSRCEDAQAFRAAARLCASETRGRFDFVLLDPPWPNRSALRSSSYNTLPDIKSLKSLLLRIDIDSHILPGGFIAVWVTNKAAGRNMLLNTNGLFETWNVTLMEEWIWVKVTSSGDPVAPVDGHWRKPYEVLLIGRKPENPLDVAASTGLVKRRVLLGVPDLHSRKPCLKPLVEDLLIQRSSNYKAIEIFARNLIAGWFSLGDEVLMYNWDVCWVQQPRLGYRDLDDDNKKDVNI